MENMYISGEYYNNNPTWHIEGSPWKAQQVLKIINNNNLQARSICEIGCGAGEILHQLSLHMDNNATFIGYEISPDAYELCKQKQANNIKFKLANLLEETSAYYDIIMAIDVIEHIEDCFGFLRALKDKGYYKIFHIPIDMTVSAVLRMSPILYGRKTVGHIHYFSKETALETLKDTGYEIIDCFFTAGALELPNRSFKSRFLSLPRRMGFSLNQNLTARILGGYSLMVLAK